MIKQYLQLVFTFIFLLLLLQVWQGYTSYQKFREYHQSLSEKSLTSTAREIDAVVESNRRSIKQFVEQNNRQILKVLKKQSSKEDLNAIIENIEKYFPFYLAFSITNTKGEVQHHHKEDLIGEVCRQEIYRYANNKYQFSPVLIHAGVNGHQHDHFDILVTVYDEGKEEGIFFISFSLASLKRALLHGEVAGHRLSLVKRDGLSQIELNDIVNDADKKIIYPHPTREDETYYLADVSDSLWMLKDVVDSTIFKNEIKQILTQTLLIIVVFSLIFWFVLRILKKEDESSGKTRDLLIAVENERRRISMDMHDQVLSGITHLGRQIDSLDFSKAIPETVKKIKTQLEDVAKSIRVVINDIHPHYLDNLGLEAAITAALNQNHSYSYSPDWEIAIDGNVDAMLNNEQRFSLYKIVLEASNNIGKHAQCTHFSIAIVIEGGTLTLTIEDDGCGFDAAKVKRGLGLNNIETRSRMLNAQVNWGKQGKGTGTTFTLVMSIRHD